VIRRDYASARQPGPVARPEARQQSWPRLAWGLVPGLALGALAGWLLLGRHAPGAAAAGPVPAVAAATPQARVALPPKQPSTYTFYTTLTRDKVGEQKQ
jgi:hypothetical protein